jgi:hypothetical protein
MQDNEIVITFAGRYETHYRNRRTGERWVEPCRYQR